MLKIRLQRTGRKHEPTFRVVLTDSKNSTKSGRYLEVLGSYDPRKTTEVFNGDRIKEWMAKGAKLSDTLHNLLVSKEIISGKKKNVLPKKSPIIDEEKLAKEKALAEEAERKAEEDKKAQEEASSQPEIPPLAETPSPEGQPNEGQENSEVSKEDTPVV